MNQTKKNNKTGLWLSLSFLLLAAAGAFVAYKVVGPNTGDMQKGEYLYIPTGATYMLVLKDLVEGGYIDDAASFDIIANRFEYPNKVKAGKYKITPGMSNLDMLRMLRNGKQEPVKLVINKFRTKEDFVKFVDEKMEPDAEEITALLKDTVFLSTYGLDTHTALVPIIPDTYEFYWNTNAEKTYERLAEYSKKFWTEERMALADSQALTPTQVIIIASIVEEETNKADEKPTVASVYINRLKKNMKLQADPTVKFALNDFAIKRVLEGHLAYDSPYNTYMYAGLPPGPINTPSKSSINAVLNAPKTDYLYFCAKEDFSGYHSFATNYTEHMKNARAYQKALNEQGIR